MRTRLQAEQKLQRPKRKLILILACLPSSTLHQARDQKLIGDADWKLRLGLQYVANSASAHRHNGSEVGVP
ncbi:MAG: hypothetical protein WA707_22390, partial [Pseudolabrys sp.]